MGIAKNKNFLLRTQAIQVIYQLHKVHEGINDKWIWETHIYPIYYISYPRFRDLMGLNVKKKLRELNNENE
jgi:ferric iron reductase protein FhuF